MVAAPILAQQYVNTLPPRRTTTIRPESYLAGLHQNRDVYIQQPRATCPTIQVLAMRRIGQGWYKVVGFVVEYGKIMEFTLSGTAPLVVS